MKTSKEFFERLQTDEVFAKEIGEKAKEKVEAGERDYKKLWIPLAEQYGYELTDEEIDEIQEKMATELSDEELGKVAGGTWTFLIMTSVYVTVISATVSLTLTMNSDGNTDTVKGITDEPVV